MMDVTRAGGGIGIPGLYVTEDPGARPAAPRAHRNGAHVVAFRCLGAGATDSAAKKGNLSLRLGLGWSKSHFFYTGQCPVMKYHRQLARAIMYDRIKPAKAVNVTVIDLEAAPQGYQDFDKG